MMSVWSPTLSVAFRLFFTARIVSALFNAITDCDETFNYWEPTHQIIYGFGFQTWEYSPSYAIRSYAYVWLYALPAYVANWLISNKMAIFYGVRCAMALACATCETYFYKGILAAFGGSTARLCFGFLLVSSGMFISSTAFLPSSFCMYCGLVALGAWCLGSYTVAVLAIGVSALLGWPFSIALGVPIAVDILFIHKRFFSFFKTVFLVSLLILLPTILVDYFYYRKLVIASLGIVLYNVFGQGGPDLYGTEPWTFYLLNGILNFNIVFLLALACPIIWALWKFLLVKLNFGADYKALYCLSPMLLWMAIFFTRPHKEERFLFPIYPLLCLAAALCINYALSMLAKVALKVPKVRGFSVISQSFVPLGTLSIFALLSLSRLLALYYGYSAPMQVYGKLYGHLSTFSKDVTGENENVCVGKEWYRFPSHFFIPSERWKIQFIQSAFKGQLPKHYASGSNATWIIPTGMNDMNKEEPDRYVDLDTCKYLIDLDDGEERPNEPNYSQQTQWKAIISAPFLIPDRSKLPYRAFYVPLLSTANTVYGSYNVLQRQ
ncbi:alpha-1,2-mannosyltransferase ALG9-like [Oscarella lobularis]|uniref:alpha-1,2-mannosyltransferase ALG9-like n=1 Tax=Oscarella lobularis TaxID=121494 RepID=UPI003313E2AE